MYFRQPILEFRSEHVGLLWAKLHKEFTTVTQNPMLGPELLVEDEPYPMPRYWLTSHDEATLIQLQKTAFLFNWRKRKVSYPHYDHVKAKFDEHYAFFMQFLRDIGISQELKIGTCELAYINVIQENKYWSSINDSAKIIPSLKTIDIGCKDAKIDSFRYNIAFNMPGDVNINVDIKSATKADESKAPVLVAELRTAGSMKKGSKSEADDWFDRAHDAIIATFLGMTNEKVQTEVWQLEKGK